MGIEIVHTHPPTSLLGLEALQSIQEIMFFYFAVWIIDEIFVQKKIFCKYYIKLYHFLIKNII